MGYAVYARRLALDHAVYAIWLAVEWSMRWVGREVRRIGNERTRERERERERRAAKTGLWRIQSTYHVPAG